MLCMFDAFCYMRVALKMCIFSFSSTYSGIKLNRTRNELNEVAAATTINWIKSINLRTDGSSAHIKCTPKYYFAFAFSEYTYLHIYYGADRAHAQTFNSHSDAYVCLRSLYVIIFFMCISGWNARNFQSQYLV